MNYFEFLDMVIDDGIAAATSDYAKPEQKEKLDGSIAGFEACRKKEPNQLLNLLKLSGNETRAIRLDDRPNIQKRPHDYWYYRCFEAEVEWVCNVVSALMMNEREMEGLDLGKPIVNPTARGVLKADELLKRGRLITNN